MSALLAVRSTCIAQFYDVDPMHVVWHGNYTRFFEEARGALLDKVNYNYQQMEESGYLWPVVEFRIKYIRPIVLHQKFIVEASLVEFKNRLKIEYLIHDLETSQVLTKAYSIQVAVKAGETELQYESPEVFLTKVKMVLG